MNAYDLQIARKVLAQQRPYFSTILYALRFHEAKDLGTMGVDKRGNLYWDPALTWSRAEIATVLYHEIGHLLRSHNGRSEAHAKAREFVTYKDGSKARFEFNQKVWNIAGDCEINADLRKEGLKFPTGWEPFYPETIGCKDGHTAEFYYDSLMANAQQVQILAAHNAGEGAKPKEGCGSCACGGEPGEHEIAPGESMVIDMKEIIRETAKEILKAGKRPGASNITEGWLQWAKRHAIDPRIWKPVLSNTIRRSIAYTTGYQDYTYSRPSRRESPEFIFPSMRRPLPHIAVALDISGSMRGDPTDVSLDALDGIFQHTGVAGLTLLCVNTELQKKVERLRKLSGIDIPYGGGTEMMACIDAANKMRPLPTTLVILTDGETRWDANKPNVDFDIVIGLVQRNYDGRVAVEHYSPLPKWARVVEVYYGG